MRWFGPPYVSFTNLKLIDRVCRKSNKGSCQVIWHTTPRVDVLNKWYHLEIVLINLSTTDQLSVYETYFQQIETSSQLEGSGTALRAEGNLFILNKK